MKIRNYALLLAVSVMATVSCNIFQNFEVDVPKLIDDNESISTAKLFDIGNDKDIKAGSAGSYILTCKADEPVSKSLEPSGTDQKIGDISIPVSSAATTVETTSSNDGQIILIIDNPSPEKLTLSGSVSTEVVTKGASHVSFEVTVPANAVRYRVLLKDSSSPSAESTDAVATVGSNFQAVVGGAKKTAPVEVELFARKAVTKASEDTKAGAVTIQADAEYKLPFTIKKGTVIKLTKSFKDLGLELSKYTGVKATKYDIKCSASSTMPFSITADGDSPQGVSATLSTPIAAGSISSPVSTSFTVAVFDNTKDHLVNEATIGLFFTAAEDNAKIDSNTGLEIYYDSAVIHKI